jgi:hypothetical protein
MSVPSIPGYLERHAQSTLADLWPRPVGAFPDELWPVDYLRIVSNNLSGWLTIGEHFFTDAKHGGTGCVLVHPEDSVAALQETSWIGRDLGAASVWGDGRFGNGLEAMDGDIRVEFFGQARRPSGASLPIIEVSQPFLWYWDAFPTSAGWGYVNRAGREQELIRWERTEDSWKIEVRILEFRQFLADSGRNAVLQLDYVHKTTGPKFKRVDADFKNNWAHFGFYAVHEWSVDGRPTFSGLFGQYVMTGLRNSRVPRFEERRQDRDYPTFIYAIDVETGHPLTHTCDPGKLGSYFDKDGTRLHYLTPIYFKREVLQPYAAEPTRYRLSPTRLSCLDLWGITISFNTAGLVEVYLGDLGRDLPSDEWGHWRTYNVPPEGTMDEGRFRRDFLNQWASSKDPVGDLRRARVKAADISRRLLGSPIWRTLPGDVNSEFESLVGPLADDPAALGPPLLLLAKALVDGIDPAPLKAHLKTFDKDEKSLRLLQRYAQELGDTSDVTSILRDLQGFRSRGGVAHLAGSGRDKAAKDLGISGLSNWDAFESVTIRVTACVNALTQLMSEVLKQPSSPSTRNGDAAD